VRVSADIVFSSLTMVVLETVVSPYILHTACS
jgi:hypothetical protein